MSASLIVHVDAQTELDAAATWYEERRVGLGLGFVAAIDRTFQRIAKRPEAFAVYRAPYSQGGRAPVSVYCLL